MVKLQTDNINLKVFTSVVYTHAYYCMLNLHVQSIMSKQHQYIIYKTSLFLVCLPFPPHLFSLTLHLTLTSHTHTIFLHSFYIGTALLYLHSVPIDVISKMYTEMLFKAFDL